MVGHLAAIGPAGVYDFRGRPLRIGDRVTWSMVWSCGECFFCRRELRAKCDGLMKFGHEALSPGRELLGGLAEYCFLPEKTAIFAVPEALSDKAACPANCATATVAAVFRHAGNVAGETVVILGAGMLGLTACAMAALQGAHQVVVIEPDHQRRQRAQAFGANAVFDAAAASEEILAHLSAHTNGRGADVVIDLSGYPEAIERGVALLRFGGRLLAAGSTFPSRPLQLSAEHITRRMQQIIGVYNYSPADLETALAFLAEAAPRYPFEELVEAAFSLDEVNAAFEMAESRRPPRVAVLP